MTFNPFRANVRFSVFVIVNVCVAVGSRPDAEKSVVYTRNGEKPDSCCCSTTGKLAFDVRETLNKPAVELIKPVTATEEPEEHISSLR